MFGFEDISYEDAIWFDPESGGDDCCACPHLEKCRNGEHATCTDILENQKLFGGTAQ